MRASRGLKWENKIYKLKRSIEECIVFFEGTILTLKLCQPFRLPIML